MPKKIDPAVKERAVRLVREHRLEYSSLSAVAAAVARQERLGVETVRRWALQAEVDTGECPGTTSEELAEIKALKARVRRLEEDNAILKSSFHNELWSRRRQMIEQARLRKAWWRSGRRSHRVRSRRNWCSQDRVRSTGQRCPPNPGPCGVPRRAMIGVIPRAANALR